MGEAQIELGHEVVGRGRDHRLEGGLGLFVPALPLADHTERETGIGKVRLDRERPRQKIGGALGIVAVIADHAQVEQAHRVGRFGLQNALI